MQHEEIELKTVTARWSIKHMHAIPNNDLH